MFSSSISGILVCITKSLMRYSIAFLYHGHAISLYHNCSTSHASLYNFIKLGDIILIFGYGEKSNGSGKLYDIITALSSSPKVSLIIRLLQFLFEHL
jgi:hypothetical protein